MFTFTLNAIFQSFSFRPVYTIGFDYSRWENVDNSGKMVFTHVIFVSAKVVKFF